MGSGMTCERNFLFEFNLPQANEAHKYTNFTVTFNACQFNYSLYICFTFDENLCCKLIPLQHKALSNFVLLVRLSKILWQTT